MKAIFFKGLVIVLPVCVIGGLVYLIFLGFYSLFSDMQLKRELDQSLAKRSSVVSNSRKVKLRRSKSIR